MAAKKKQPTLGTAASSADHPQQGESWQAKTFVEGLREGPKHRPRQIYWKLRYMTSGHPEYRELLRKSCHPDDAMALDRIHVAFNSPDYSEQFFVDRLDPLLRRRCEGREIYALTLPEVADFAEGNIARKEDEQIGQADPEAEAKKTDRFAELLNFAADNLKGNQFRAIKLIAQADGACPLSKLAQELNWDASINERWNSLSNKANKKIKRIGWRLYRQDSKGRLKQIMEPK